MDPWLKQCTEPVVFTLTRPLVMGGVGRARLPAVLTRIITALDPSLPADAIAGAAQRLFARSRWP